MISNRKVGYNTRTITVLLILILGFFYFSDGIVNVLTWDTFGYNSYLPLVFEKGSFHVGLDYFQKINANYENYASLYQYVDLPNGNVFIRYTMGWAVLYAPFYSIAEVWANLGGYTQDGFSYPYQFMAFIGSFFYLILSLLLLRKVLLLFFNEKMSTTVMLIIGLGTNFFYMYVSNPGLTHNLIFVLVCFFILRTHRFHQNATIGNALLLGISVGLIALTRTPSVVISVFAIFYNYKAYGPSPFHKIIYFLKNHSLLVAIAIFSAILTFSPQMYYWKTTSGDYLINSYANNPGEGMDWFTPHWISVLFSFKNGLLIYTPIMFFALIGFYFWIKKDSSSGISGLFSFIVFFYVVSCWTLWWYPLHFGHRGMFDIYPILAVGLGYFLTSFQRKWIYIPIGCLMCFNLFQIYQVDKGLLRGSLMTKEAYLDLLFETNPLTEKQLNLREFDPSLYESSKVDIKKFKLIHQEDLEIPEFVLSPEHNMYAPGLTLQLKKLKDVPHLLLRSTWTYKGTPSQLEGKIFNTHMKYGDQVYWWRGNQYKDLTVFHDSIHKTVTVDYFAPTIRTKQDLTYTGLWAQSGDSIGIQHLNVKVYEWAPPKRNK